MPMPLPPSLPPSHRPYLHGLVNGRRKHACCERRQRAAWYCADARAKAASKAASEGTAAPHDGAGQRLELHGARRMDVAELVLVLSPAGRAVHACERAGACWERRGSRLGSARWYVLGLESCLLLTADSS
eukprot:364316-Chlamydomonas_euryale.AAC.13